MSLKEEINKQSFNRASVMADLVISAGFLPAQLEPVERALAGNMCAVRPIGGELTGQHRHHRIVAQVVMIVEILIAQCKTKHALAYQSRNVMLMSDRRGGDR